jgi:hypothetical protein
MLADENSANEKHNIVATESVHDESLGLPQERLRGVAPRPLFGAGQGAQLRDQEEGQFENAEPDCRARTRTRR